MVLRGQYLERPALVACGELTLEGLWHRGARPPGVLLCPPVDAAGMDAPPLAELAWACARAGHPSLRFQHRGFGASEGARDPERALEDAEAALRHLAESAPGALAVVGLGSGCATALGLLGRHPELSRGVLLAPTVAPAPAGEGRLLALLPAQGSPVSEGEVARALGGRGRAAVVEGADAHFRAGLPRAAAMAVAFLEGG